MKEKNGNLVRMNITLSAAVHQYYKQRSAETGVSMSSLMFLDLERAAMDPEERALEEFLDSFEQYKSGEKK